MNASKQELTLLDLRELPFVLMEQFEALCTHPESEIEPAEAKYLGELVAIYRDFHRSTNAMQPSRAVDFSATCLEIERKLEATKAGFGDHFREALLTAVPHLPDDASSVPAMPHLSTLTLNRLEQSPHAYEAVTHYHYPRRR